jgi:all-trans-retinol 13,14-reductase
MKYDCLIIGGGLSGMTAAIIMAQKGFHTALVEKSRQTAPTVRGFKRQGLFFDTGFHYTGGLNEGEPLDIFFHYLGLSQKITPYPFDPEGFDIFRCLEPEFEFSFPFGYERIRERLSERFPKNRKALEGYLEAVKKTFHSQPYIDLTQDMNTPEWPLIHQQSLREVLNKVTDDPLLQGVLSMHCLLHGVSPEEVSFSNHAVVAGSYYESANGVIGGGQGLAEAFEERLNELGVDVFCGSGVQEILLSAEQGVSGIRVGEGQILEGPCCISTVHPRILLELVPDSGFRPIYRKRLEGLEDTFSAVIVYAKSSLPLKTLAKANLFLVPNPRILSDEGAGPVEENPLFITRARQDDDSVSEEGCVIICPAPHTGSGSWKDLVPSLDPAAYRSFKTDMSRRIITHLENACPEFKDRITAVDCATPLTLQRFTNSPAGSLYGVKHKIAQVNPLPVTKIKGLFLAGQSIAAPGLLGAVYSGFLACGNLMGHRKLRGELKAWT